jgi:hypothetical protein
MTTALFNSLLECRTLEETLKLASLYAIAQHLESEYQIATAAGSDSAAELYMNSLKARFAYMDAVEGRN